MSVARGATIASKHVLTLMEASLVNVVTDFCWMLMRLLVMVCHKKQIDNVISIYMLYNTYIYIYIYMYVCVCIHIPN